MTSISGGITGTAIPQPLQPFFDLQIGGLRKIFVGPQIPIDFEYDSGLESSMVKFTLFDVTGFQVEPAIWNSRSQNPNGMFQGQFQFGWQGSANIQSPVYAFTIDDYIPQFIGNAFAITVIGSVTPISIMGSTNQYSGTAQEIFQDIASNYNMQLNIQPPLGINYMRDTGYVDKDSTELIEMQHTKWVTESDWSYLQRVARWCIGQDGKGGYSVNISSNGGQLTLNVIRPQTVSSSLSYTVQAEGTTVVGWEPHIDSTAVMFGADNWVQNTYQRSSGDEQKLVLNQAVTKPYQVLFNNEDTAPIFKPSPVPQGQPDALTFFNSETMPATVTGASSRARPGSSSSPYGGINPLLNDHLKAWMQGSTAALTILGDPTIDPWNINNQQMQTVDVTCFYPNNYFTNQTSQVKHYTSGTYQIQQVKHIIRAGSYLTILGLMRADLTQPSTSVQQVQ